MENIKNISFSTEELSGVMASVWPKLLDLLQEKQDTLFVRPLSGYFDGLTDTQIEAITMIVNELKATNKEK